MESNLLQIGIVTISICICMIVCESLLRLINAHSKMLEMTKLSSIKNRRVANKQLDNQYKRVYIDIVGIIKVKEDLMIIITLIAVSVLALTIHALNGKFRIMCIILDSLFCCIYINTHKHTNTYTITNEEKIKLSIVKARAKFNCNEELTDNDRKLLEKDFQNIEKAFNLDIKKNNFKLTQNRINNLNGKLESFIYNKA